ncbi:ATP synthase gamma chain, partial [Aduncisulcus paluster]
QITKAMNMVASAKLRGAQDRIERFRPYADKFYEMLGDLAAGADSSVHPLLEVHEEIKTVGIVLATSDRGLCGAAAIKKTEYEIIEAYNDDMGSFDFNLAASIGNKVIDAYLAEDLDEVFLVFGKFVNVASQPPETLQILPMSSDAAGEEAESGATSEYIYEPSVEG